MKTYAVNEVFLSLQGEGLRAGTLNVFVRFAGCNLTCSRDGEAGFDCDTEFLSSVKMTAAEIAGVVAKLWPDGRYRLSVILTGGEPMLQVDAELLAKLRELNPLVVAVETNGTRVLPDGVERTSLFLSCSPKSAEHTLLVGDVDELRYVRHVGQGVPKPALKAVEQFLSPAWSPDSWEVKKNLEHCIALVKANPPWRLSLQQHKLWGLR